MKNRKFFNSDLCIYNNILVCMVQECLMGVQLTGVQLMGASYESLQFVDFPLMGVHL